MTVIYKKAAPGVCTGEQMIIVNDARTKRMLYHQRLQSRTPDQRYCTLPLEIFTEHSEVEIHNDLSDPQIAICAPSVLSLFADNFDFESRDDFIRGLLINEEILASTIYMAELPSEQYAAKVQNWQMYQIVSNDIINRWVYPLVPDMGICSLKQNYIFLRNNVYRNKTVQLARSAVLKENVVIYEKCTVDDGTKVSHSVVGKNCSIGRNCTLENVYLFENVIIEDGCLLKHCVVGENARISKECVLRSGAVIGSGCVIPEKSIVEKQFVFSAKSEDAFGSDDYVKLGERAYIQQSTSDERGKPDATADSDEEDNLGEIVNLHMSALEYKYESSIYSSSSDDEESDRQSPVPEDANSKIRR